MTKRPSAVALAGPAPGNRRRRKASAEIIESLRHSVASGELKRGERLPTEGDLAAHFGVSQPTVREALRVIETMGLIEVRHGSGAYVTGDTHQFVSAALQTLLQMDRVGIIEVVEMRTALGGYSASRVVKFATESDLQAIEEHARRLEAAAQLSDVEQMTDAFIAFQVSVSAAAHNPLLLAIDSVLIEFLVRLQVDAFSRRNAAFWRKWSERFTNDRRELVASFRDRDEERAVEVMMRYLEHQRTRFASDKTLAAARLSDPEVLRVIQPNVMLGAEPGWVARKPG